MPHKSCLRCAYNNGLRRALPYGVPTHFPEPALQRNGARLDAISKADAAMSRLVIAAGLKLIVVPIDSTWMRRSLASGSRARASHASSARAGRSRQRQSKWAGSTRRCTRTALVTAPFPIGHDPGSSSSGIAPEIGNVLPMERAEEAFRAMWEGKTHGKTVFTR
jgi:hypothetical protein